MCRSSLVSLVLLAACVDSQDVPEPPVEPPVEPPSEALVQVEIHALGSELVFHRADGTLFSRVPITEGVATADVPANSSVTVVRPAGHLVVGGRPVQFHGYTTATALADGDVIDLIPPEADLPAVQVTLPALPADAPKVTAYWCGRAQESAGAVLELARDRCDTRGALFIASAAAPLYGMIVPDLGNGTIDLSAGRWLPIAPVAVTLHPAPSPDRVWLVGGGAIVDNQVVRFGPSVAATEATVMVPMFAGGAVTASLGQSGSPAAFTRIAETRLDGAPFTLSIPGDDAFPALTASMTGPRALTLLGDFATHRAVTQITATVADESNLITWQLHLRGDDDAFTFPSEGLASGTIRRIDLDQRAPTVERLSTRRLSF
jgi:hypothetical protein